MADDVELNPGVGGKIIRADEVGGALHQSVKITIGADGVDGGFVDGVNPLPVSVSGSLVPESHDWVGVTYNDLGKIGTVTYRTGGPGGEIVATLTLAYVAGRLSSIAKS